MKVESIYLYDKVLDQYFIESNPERFDAWRINNSVKELTKDKYYAATLPDWGSDIINSLSK